MADFTGKKQYRAILKSLSVLNFYGPQEVLHFINILKTNRLYILPEWVDYSHASFKVETITVTKFEDLPAELQEYYKDHMEELIQPEETDRET